MSKLKAFVARKIDDGTCDPVPCVEVYLKSEADKVIAHNKYKRCLAMADMCRAKYDEEDAKVNGCGVSWEYINKEMKYLERWQWRWENLSEKFKEAK